ncbi:MAG TPA: hemerythrin domain-containing protein [Candidatus Limnocylindrales bacterium]|nr:hemerythrin domain-containing protein [Candidatus Limnocylindrales bacterium]
MTITISDPEAAAAAAIRAHHAELGAGLRQRTEGLHDAVRLGLDEAAARSELLAFLRGELLPHAAAEERTLYPAAARGRASLLVEAMLEEHRRLLAEVDALAAAPAPILAASAAAAIRALFDAHLWKENELLVPFLAAEPDLSLAGLLGGMHELVG